MLRTRQQREYTGRVVGGPSRGLGCSQAANLKLGKRQTQATLLVIRAGPSTSLLFDHSGAFVHG